MNIEIANRLVQLRKQHGFSQEELAEKLGLSRQSVSKWERAEASPDTDNLILLSRIYGISLDELLKTDEPIPVKESQKGVKVTINGKPVRFDAKDGFYFTYGDEEDEEARHNTSGAHIHIERNNNDSVWTTFPFPIFITILYLGLGFAWNLWHPAWILFLTIPAYYPIVGWFTGSRRHTFWKSFPFTMLTVIAFLCLGCIWGLWHPAWILCLFFPIYHSIVKVADRKYRKKHGYDKEPIYVEDDDDDD